MAKTKSWKTLVKTIDPEHDKKQPVYIFSKNRKFVDKDDPYSGAKN